MAEGQGKSSSGAKESARSVVAWVRKPQAPTFLLATISVVAAAWFLTLSSGEYFFSDEWSRFSFFPNVGFEWSLHGGSGHLIFLNVLLYRGLLELFGGGSYLPFRLISLALQLAAVWLLFLYLRPRANGWLVVGLLAPLLFLGSAWVVTASAYGIVILTPIVLGLAALLMLDRPDRYSDLVASVLLVLAVLAHSGALPFLVGAGVLIAVGGSRRRARSWVIAPAVVVFIGWFVWARYLSPDLDFFEEPLSISNASFLLQSLVQTPAAALAAATGTFYRLDGNGALDFNIGPGYVLLALALLGLLFLWRRGSGSLSDRVLVPASMLLVFSVLVAFGMSDPARQATSPRYLYFTTMCALWIFCEVAPTIRWRPWGYGALAAVLGVSVLANANIYGKAASSLRDAGTRSRAAVTALEIAGSAANPWLRASDVVQAGASDGAFSKWPISLDQGSIERFGSAAYSPRALAEAGPQAEAIVDRLLIGAEQIRLGPVEGSGGRLRCIESPQASRNAGSDLIEVDPGATLILRAASGKGPITVAVSRFANLPFPLGSVTASKSQQISFPADRSVQPWQVTLTPGGRARLCLLE